MNKTEFVAKVAAKGDMSNAEAGRAVAAVLEADAAHDALVLAQDPGPRLAVAAIDAKQAHLSVFGAGRHLVAIGAEVGAVHAALVAREHGAGHPRAQQSHGLLARQPVCGHRV